MRFIEAASNAAKDSSCGVMRPATELRLTIDLDRYERERLPGPWEPLAYAREVRR
ncbi:hypothetical protein EV384_6225 [Micromonospora kangleipakensis]|uniref:Uncharacterized protein n=1 Tax=Micromonospora kangleipakensis TaxID=1077942 RepID=A0A4Q8BJG2_9ACTN|nr:hypothetical protein EV384_6225 [Micromonospora kangleipakensis]